MDERHEMRVLLYESGPDEEQLRIEGFIDHAGSLHVRQTSAGPLTRWCFEETPHDVEMSIDAEGVRALAALLELDAAEQLPAALQIRFAGYDGAMRLRECLKEGGVPYAVNESRIVR